MTITVTEEDSAFQRDIEVLLIVGNMDVCRARGRVSDRPLEKKTIFSIVWKFFHSYWRLFSLYGGLFFSQCGPFFYVGCLFLHIGVIFLMWGGGAFFSLWEMGGGF